MKKLITLLLLLALMTTTVGVAFAGLDWDGDPLLQVGRTKVHVDFSIAGGDFVRDGGQITLVATAPDIRLVSRGPRYLTVFPVSGGQSGELQLTTTLSGADVPDDFLVRVRVPNKGYEEIQRATNGATLTFHLP